MYAHSVQSFTSKTRDTAVFNPAMAGWARIAESCYLNPRVPGGPGVSSSSTEHVPVSAGGVGPLDSVHASPPDEEELNETDFDSLHADNADLILSATIPSEMFVPQVQRRHQDGRKTNRTNKKGSHILRASLREHTEQRLHTADRLHAGRPLTTGAVAVASPDDALQCAKSPNYLSSLFEGLLTTGSDLQKSIAACAYKFFASSSTSASETSALLTSLESQDLETLGTIESSQLLPPLPEDSSTTLSTSQVGSTHDHDDLEDCSQVLLITQRLLCCPERPMASGKSESEFLQISRRQFQRTLIRTAACNVEVGVHAWKCWIAKVKQFVIDRKFKVRMILKHRIYDETPLRLRIESESHTSHSTTVAITASQSTMGAMGSTTEVQSCIAKVLQTRFKLGFLLQAIPSGKLAFVHGIVPTWLQCLEKTKAEDLCWAQSQFLDQISDINDLADAIATHQDGAADDDSCLHSHVSSTDRYSANLPAERGLQALQLYEHFANLECRIHKAATSQTWNLKVVDGDISAIVAAGLMSASCGITSDARMCLGDEIMAKIQVVHGDPPGGRIMEYRLEVYDLYLSIDNISRLSDTSKHTTRRKVQRMILDWFLSGDLQDESAVFFYPRGMDIDVENVVRTFIVPALIPITLPVFPRHRWVGGDIAVDWLGLVQSHHGLLKPVLMKISLLVSDSKKPQSGSEAPSGLGVRTWGDEFNSMLALLDAKRRHDADETHDHIPTPVTGLPPDMQQAVDEQEGGDDKQQVWAEMNKSFKRKVHAWASDRDLNVLCIIRHGMHIFGDLFRGFFYLSGEKFEQDQQYKMSQGLPRSYRLSEAYLGTHVAAAFVSINASFHKTPPALPARSMTVRMKVLMFQLLSRGAGALEYFLRSVEKGCPYILFGALANPSAAHEFRDLRKCLWDGLVHGMMSVTPVAGLDSDVSLARLHGLALLLELDVASIECRHGSLRNLLDHGDSTWDMLLEFLSAQFQCRQATIEKKQVDELLARSNAEAQDTSKKKRPPRKKKRGRASKQKRLARQAETSVKRGGGGAQRAFFHKNLQTAPREDYRDLQALFTRLNAEFKQVPEEEKAEYREQGKMATISKRAGGRSFAASTSHRMPDISATGRPIVHNINDMIKETRKQARAVNEKNLAEERTSKQHVAKHVSKQTPAVDEGLWYGSRIVTSADAIPTAFLYKGSAELTQARRASSLYLDLYCAVFDACGLLEPNLSQSITYTYTHCILQSTNQPVCQSIYYSIHLSTYLFVCLNWGGTK